MAPISQTTIQMHIFNENVNFLLKFHLKFVPKGPIDNNPPLV